MKGKRRKGKERKGKDGKEGIINIIIFLKRHKVITSDMHAVWVTVKSVEPRFEN